LSRAEQVLSELEGEGEERGIIRKKVRRKEPQPQQLPLLEAKPPLLEELSKLDISSMTPLEALNKLYELQQKAREI
jgi:DNA mismatch repair protein MutS